MSTRYLSAGEAADELGISKNTLYAYVSRGLIRSEAVPGGSRRTRRYPAEDVRRLKEQRERQRDPSRAARTALDFGLPVLPSALTLIEDGRFFYRGRDACELARTRSLRAVAALLWRGDLDAAPPARDAPAPSFLAEALRATPETRPALERFEAALPAMATRDERAFDRSEEGTARTGARLLRLMQAALAGGAPPDDTPLDLTRALQARWGDDEAAPERLVRAALVLCADHGLNVTAMAARCAASAGASPYRAVQAGLSTLRGRDHAGGMARVEAMLREAGAPGNLRATLAARRQRGAATPGFGHRLYPEGDPRAALLAEMLREMLPASEGAAFLERAAEAGPALLGHAPNLSFALVALRRALAWPEEAPLTLFAAGRMAGWIGHAIEQYAAEYPIRPRASYTGPPAPS
jgi:citrate synthase